MSALPVLINESGLQQSSNNHPRSGIDLFDFNFVKPRSFASIRHKNIELLNGVLPKREKSSKRDRPQYLRRVLLNAIEATLLRCPSHLAPQTVSPKATLYDICCALALMIPRHHFNRSIQEQWNKFIDGVHFFVTIIPPKRRLNLQVPTPVEAPKQRAVDRHSIQASPLRLNRSMSVITIKSDSDQSTPSPLVTRRHVDRAEIGSGNKKGKAKASGYHTQEHAASLKDGTLNSRSGTSMQLIGMHIGASQMSKKDTHVVMTAGRKAGEDDVMDSEMTSDDLSLSLSRSVNTTSVLRGRLLPMSRSAPVSESHSFERGPEPTSTGSTGTFPPEISPSPLHSAIIDSMSSEVPPPATLQRRNPYAMVNERLQGQIDELEKERLFLTDFITAGTGMSRSAILASRIRVDQLGQTHKAAWNTAIGKRNGASANQPQVGSRPSAASSL